MADVSKGDKFVAGGTLKEFTVEGVKDGIVTLKETGDASPDAVKPEPEVITVPERTLVESQDWKGIEEA